MYLQSSVDSASGRLEEIKTFLIKSDCFNIMNRIQPIIRNGIKIEKQIM
jgi:hypothetical protein